jgi:ubiquinone biosynthesis protein UbiJ
MPYISRAGKVRPYELSDAYKQIQELRKLVEELKVQLQNLEEDYSNHADHIYP